MNMKNHWESMMNDSMNKASEAFAKMQEAMKRNDCKAEKKFSRENMKHRDDASRFRAMARQSD